MKKTPPELASAPPPSYLRAPRPTHLALSAVTRTHYSAFSIFIDFYFASLLLLLQTQRFLGRHNHIATRVDGKPRVLVVVAHRVPAPVDALLDAPRVLEQTAPALR